MKYFIAYFFNENDLIYECYLKGKSIDFILERIERYSNGHLVTSKTTIVTSNFASAYVREVNVTDFPFLSKSIRDFAFINENKSFDQSDLQ